METDPEYGEECDHTSDEVTAGRNAKEAEWQAAWYDGDCKDANRDTTKWLKEHIEKLTGGKSGCRILVPMCGAARDMHWLLDQGHTLVGIELVDKALRMFLDRHSIQYEVSPVPSIKDGMCYKSKDGNLVLYRCNIFDMDMSLVGKVDGVWDSGAMTDIPPAERIQYGEIILSALSPGGRILAETFTFGEKKDVKDNSADGQNEEDCDHDQGCQHGSHQSHDHDAESSGCHHDQGKEDNYDFPCRPVEMQDFEKMYGERCTIELLEDEDSKEYGCEEWGPNWWAKDRLHLVIVKDQEAPDGNGAGGARKRGAEHSLSEDAAETKKTKNDADN